MTEQDLTKIEARADAATPGPWIVTEEGEGDGQLWIETADRRYPICGFDAGMGAACGEGEANGTFIALARMDVPLLLAEVRRLWAWLETVRDHARLLAPAELEECAQAALNGQTLWRHTTRKEQSRP